MRVVVSRSGSLQSCAQALAYFGWPVDSVSPDHHYERLRIKENMLNHQLDYMQNRVDAREARYNRMIANIQHFSSVR